MIVVNRFGFFREHQHLNLEMRLQAALSRMAEHGHRIISVSVLTSTRPDESHEAYVVSEHE